jgi:hypothetical protein
MRKILFLVAGLFLMASLLIVAKMFSEHFPRLRTGQSPLD